MYRHFTDQAEIDAQYNAGASVRDYEDFLKRWEMSSQAAREELPCHLNVAYGQTRAETLDIFPAEVSSAPVHVFFHGGYWRSLSKSEFSFVARGPRRAGFTTVVVDYALCPWVSIDEIVRQARSAVAWVYRNIERYGGDPSRITLSGHSAGGHLTAMSLLTPWVETYDLPEDVVRAALCISGLHDLAPLRYSYLQPALQIDEGVIARNSPVRLVKRVAAPVLLAWGEQESAEFARQSLDLATALAGTGTRAQTCTLHGAHHFSVLDGFLDPQSRLCRALHGAIDA
jgi:arylformamidase